MSFPLSPVAPVLYHPFKSSFPLHYSTVLSDRKIPNYSESVEVEMVPPIYKVPSAPAATVLPNALQDRNSKLILILLMAILRMLTVGRQRRSRILPSGNSYNYAHSMGE